MQPLPSKWKIRTEAWRQLSEAYAAGLDIWVSGASGSGKSSLVLDFFKGKHFTYISGSNFESLKQVIKHLIRLSGEPRPKSIDMSLLVWRLAGLEFKGGHYFVFDKLELFLSAQPDFITDLLQVREAVAQSLHICLIGESSSAGSQLSFYPVEIQLSPYSREETKEILKGQFHDMSPTLFDFCFRAVEARLFLETRQISAYKFTFAKLYTSSFELEGKPAAMLGKMINSILEHKRVIGKNLCSPLLKLNRECKLLLAAAYLCSRSPESADLRIFKSIASRERIKSNVYPKYFSTERLLAIFDVLSSLNARTTHRHSLELLASLKSLNEQGLIGFKGSDGLTQKMICLIDLEQFKLVCGAVGIASSNYLHNLSF